jgi:hypothetical protein
MKVADIRNAWQAEGMHVATLPANEVVDDRSMLAYYDSYPGHKHYDELRKPNRFDRYVLLGQDGKFLIIPMNPAIYTVLEE